MALTVIGKASPVTGPTFLDAATLASSLTQQFKLDKAALDNAAEALAALLDEAAQPYYLHDELNIYTIFSKDFEYHPCISSLNDKQLSVAWMVSDYLMLQECSDSLCEVRIIVLTIMIDF
jgi:hypothetical protein